MANDTDLQLVIKMRDEASATLKTLEGELKNLSKQTEATASAVKQSDTALGRMVQSMTGLAQKSGVAEVAMSRFGKVTGVATDIIQNHAAAAGDVGAVLMRLGPAGVIAAAGIGAVAASASQGLSAYIAFERQSIKLQSALIASGQAGKATFAGLHDAARDISRGTIFDTDATSSAMASLVKNGMISAEKLKRIMPGVLDFAAGTGRDPGEAAKMVSLMYSNPERGIMQMAREMKNITHTEKADLERMVKSGDYEAAADRLFAKMATRNQGQAQMLTAGIGGAYQQINKELGEWSADSSRAFGQMIADSIGLEGKLRGILGFITRIRATSSRDTAIAGGGTPEERIAGLREQRLMVDKGDTRELLKRGGGGLMPGFLNRGKSDEQIRAEIDAEIAAEQAKVGTHETATVGERNAAGRATSKFEARKQIDNAEEYLIKLDPILAKQRDLNVEIKAFENGIASAYAQGDGEAMARFANGLQKVRVELLQNLDAVKKLEQANAKEVSQAGLSSGAKVSQSAYDKTAAAVAERDKIFTAGQLSNDPEVRAKAGPLAKGVTEDRRRDAMLEVQEKSRADFEALFSANFEREARERQQELALILRSLQPGRVGQDAAADLTALRAGRAAGPDGSAAFQRTQSRTRGEAEQEAAERRTVKLQQEMRDIMHQTQAAQLQARLMQGGGGVQSIATGASVQPPADLRAAFDKAVEGKAAGFSRYFAAIIQGESSFNPNIRDGSAGEIGMGQVKPSTAMDPGYGVTKLNGTLQEVIAQLRIPAVNLKFAADYAEGRARSAGVTNYNDRGQVQTAAENYNAGSGRVAYGRAAVARTFDGGRINIPIPQQGVSEGEAKVRTSAITQANKLRDEGTITEAELPAKIDELTKAMLGLTQAENDPKLIAERTKVTNDQKATAALVRGGPMAQREAQYGAQADQQGLQGDQRNTYLQTQRDASMAQYNSGQAEKNQASQNSLALTEKEIELASALPEVRQRELEKLKLKQELVRATGGLETDAYREAVAYIDKTADASERLRRAQGPLNSWLTDAKQDWRNYEQVAVSALDSTISGLSGVLAGTEKAGDAARKLISSFASMATNAAFKSLISSVAGAATGDGGVLSGLGGLFGGGAGAGGGGISSAAAGVKPFANGGIMTDRGVLPLRKYAGGGVATSPQLALFGEGKSPAEAYVPLPDGRSIPVSMRGGGGGGGGQQHNEFNVTVNTGGGGGQSQGQGQNPKEVGDAVAAALHQKIVEVMHDQTRAGGALNPVM